ncbi:MAG TPA: ribonuclease III [Allosphingosinicella sp.]|jgi:ribonuclease-3
MDRATLEWLGATLGHRPRDTKLYQRALTHPSHSGDNYERLEFLGDRVLGLTMAEWLIEDYPDEAEGKLSTRFAALVAGNVCASVARDLGVPAHLRLGRQAQDDGVFHSDNVLGDVTEALIGALYLDAGLEPAKAFIHRIWESRVASLAAPPKHPKAVLQEWTAANNRRPPEYKLVETSGPDHAPRFTISVSVRGKGEATGKGTTKQEAEKAAALAMLEQLQ